MAYCSRSILKYCPKHAISQNLTNATLNEVKGLGRGMEPVRGRYNPGAHPQMLLRPPPSLALG